MTRLKQFALRICIPALLACIPVKTYALTTDCQPVYEVLDAFSDDLSSDTVRGELSDTGEDGEQYFKGRVNLFGTCEVIVDAAEISYDCYKRNGSEAQVQELVSYLDQCDIPQRSSKEIRPGRTRGSTTFGPKTQYEFLWKGQIIEARVGSLKTSRGTTVSVTFTKE